MPIKNKAGIAIFHTRTDFRARKFIRNKERAFNSNDYDIMIMINKNDDKGD